VNRQKEYLLQRIETASPLDLIRILYEAALERVNEALTALHSGDIIKRGHAVTKAIEILSELQMSLRCDVQPEYSNTLSGLYSYMQQQLIRAHAEQSESLLQEVARLLGTLLEGWMGAVENLASETGKQDAPQHRPETPAAFDSNPYGSASAAPRVRSWQL
jgi:flagellar secretion chaperone FliS